MLKDILSKAKKVIAISTQMISDYRSLGIPMEKIVFIPNGVDITKFKPCTNKEKVLVRKELGIPAQNVVFIFTGRLIKSKGIQDLIDAFSFAEKENSKLFLIVVGGVNKDISIKRAEMQETALVGKAWATDLEDACTKAKVAGVNNIKFTWFVNNVEKYLAASDIFVFPSYSEGGMSNSLLEAMSTGLAVLASDIPANASVIDNEETGLLFKMGNITDLKTKMLYLASDRSLIRKLGRNARKEVLKTYDINITSRKYAELLAGL